MSSSSLDQDGVLEAQQGVLHKTNNPPKVSWRVIFLILQARRVLISATVKAKKGSHPLARNSYSVISSNGTADTNVDLSEIEEILQTPQVSLDVPSAGEDGDSTSDIQLQHENIAKIVKARDLDSLRKLGGVRVIAEALNTNLETGITGDSEDLSSRRRVNAISKTEVPAGGFFHLLVIYSNSYVILLLFMSAVLSLSFGIQEEGLRTGWYEGVVIILAIIILVAVPPIRESLYENSENLSGEQKPLTKRQMAVHVLRAGNLMKVSASDVVIGDIVSLKSGCLIPGDGLFLSGEYLKLDDCFSSTINQHNPFLFFGAKVMNGHGYMLVTSVGMNTAWGEMMSKVSHSPSKTQLPVQLGKVSTQAQIAGLATSILILLVFFLRFKLGKENANSGLPELKGEQKAMEVMDLVKRIVLKPSGKISVLITSLAIFLVGMVEGVPFVISLAVTYWNKKILSNKASVQEQLTGVTMSSVTTICTDKIGGLTLNSQEVDMCWIGEDVIHEDSVVADQVIEAFCAGISTPILMLDGSAGSIEESQSLVSWATLNLGMELENFKQSCTIFMMKNLSLGEEGSGILVRNNGDEETGMFLHWTGPAPTILMMCSRYYDSEGTMMVMDEEKRMVFEKIIMDMESRDLKTIALAYKPTDVETPEDDDLILIGLLGLKDTCWIESTEAMKACRNASIDIILVSEENVAVLEAIALKCGVLVGSGRLMLDGETFRNFTDKERMDVVDKISVMGNSLPSDKLLLVQCLKQKDHIVAFVGVTTNETPALKEADFGIAMGSWSSELARGSSDLVILDGNFSLLVSILECGRCIYDNIQKYIQVEITITISGLLINIVAAIVSGDTPITGIQMVWVNLIVAVLGGFALLTEPPSEKLMNKPPVRPTEPFIKKAMWRNILTQAFYQAAILLAFQFKGQAVLKISEEVSKAMIFNSFFLCQLFNLLNAREQKVKNVVKLFNAKEQKVKNVVKGFQQNLWFWVASALTVVLQMAFIEIAHYTFGFAKLNKLQWGICFLIGTLSCVIDGVVKITAPSDTQSAYNLELPLINGNSAPPSA